MRTFLPALLVVLTFLSLDTIIAQSCGNTAFETLQANQVKAIFSNAGDMFNDGAFNEGLTVPYVPGLPEVRSIFAASLALAGMDAAGELRVSFVSYRYDNSATDYRSGPLDDQTGQPVENGCANFDRLWLVNRYDIVSLIEDFEDNGTIDQPIPENILKWPARGNTFFASQMGFELPDQDLAPFFDRNNNGIYEPDNGEYPVIGSDLPTVIPDELLWTVFNDVGNGHPNTATEPLGVEVHLIAYAFNCADDEVLNQSIFTRHKILLKGNEPLTDVMGGLWFDPDLGCFEDDFMGFDTTLNTVYVYNSDNVDGITDCICAGGVATYCENPPTQAITILSHPMYKGMVFNNGGVGNPPPGTADPATPLEIYRYMNGFWRDGTPLTFGGNGYNPGSNEVIDAPFFNNPNDPTGWSMATEASPFLDRRAIFSIAPSDLQPGESFTIDVAYSYHRETGADHLENVNVLLEEVPGIQAKYDNQFSDLCSQSQLCDTDCVWPGDADNSGRVDKDDVLSVGVGVGHAAMGNNRNPTSFNWIPQNAEDWPDSFVDGTNFKHSDCNGDGIISTFDAALIDGNYGLEVPGYIAPEDQPIEDADIRIWMDNNKEELSATSPSELQRLLRTDLFLGSESHPVEGLYGIAFTLLFDTSLMETAFINPAVANTFDDFLGDDTENLSVSMAMPERGRVDFGFSRTDGQEFSGWGQMGEIWLQLREDAVTSNPTGSRNIVYQIVNLKAIDFEENLLDIGARSDTTLATNLTFDPGATATEQMSLDNNLRLSPNPNKGLLHIQLLGVSSSQEVDLQLFNLQGQPVFEKQLVLAEEGSRIQLPGQLVDGIYLVVLSDSKGQRWVQKLIISCGL